MRKKKITFIGGGSYQWVPTLFRDIAVNPRLVNTTFVLHDIEPVRNSELAGVCRVIAGKLYSPIEIHPEDHFDRAIAGASAVILCVSTGGLNAMEHDIEIPKKYGIYQPVGDSTGPGGISRTLRNVPVVTAIAKRMEELCPDAWLLNLSNPMGQIVRAISKTSKIKVVGLCHEYMCFMKKLEEMFGLESWQREITAAIAGINHFAWITRLSIEGRDGLALLQERIESAEETSIRTDGRLVNLSQVLSGDQVKFALFQIYGAIPYPGDRHLVEFFPHFLSEKTRHGGDFGVCLTSIEDRRTTWIDDFKARISLWTNSNPDSVPREPSDESMAPILASLLEGEITVQPVTLPNDGHVLNLPRGAAVETLATFGRNMLSPHASGPLPDSLLSLVHRHCINQELTVDGAIEGDRQKILQALIADPLTNNNDFRQISVMLKEMMDANADLLPQFYALRKGKMAA